MAAHHASQPIAARGLLTRLLDSRNALGLVFMLPAAVILLLFLTYPLGLGTWLGFTDTKIGRSGEFVGETAEEGDGPVLGGDCGG